MHNRNISARYLITKESYDSVLEDYRFLNTLSTTKKKRLEEEYEKIHSEETPPLALKRHGTLPPPNWKEILIAQNERRERFRKEHPAFCCDGVAEELRSVLTNKRAVLNNTFRKRRAPINEVNIIVNDDYFVVIYNRLINSSQTSVVFSGVPLRAIEDMDCFGFLKQYIPNIKHDFTIKTSTIKTPEKYYMGLSELTFSRLIINEE